MVNLDLKTFAKTCLVTFLFLGSPLAADESATAMPEPDLRTLVPFGPDALLKYAGCEEKAYPTCTYIWGLPDSDDAMRVQLGGKPDGDKLITTFAQANQAQDFDRVLSSYKDAVPVEDLGVLAVWSEARAQLSLMTNDNLIIHVHVQISNEGEIKAVAKQVATYLLAAR